MSKTVLDTQVGYTADDWNKISNWLLKNKIPFYRLVKLNSGSWWYDIGIDFKTEKDLMAFKIAHSPDFFITLLDLPSSGSISLSSLR